MPLIPEEPEFDLTRHKLNTYTSMGNFTDYQEHMVDVHVSETTDIVLTPEVFTPVEVKYKIKKQDILDIVETIDWFQLHLRSIKRDRIPAMIDDIFLIYINSIYSRIDEISINDLVTKLKNFTIYSEVTPLHLRILKESLTGTVLVKCNDYPSSKTKFLLEKGLLFTCLLNDDFDNKKETLVLSTFGNEMLEIENILNKALGNEHA